MTAPAYPLAATDRVLVTGGSGFVGGAVLRALAIRGLRARALARAESNRRNLADAAEVAIGDLADAGSVARAMADVDVLFHLAADYRLWSRRPAEITHANLEGTRVVMEAALAAGVRRIVHTSSVATLRAPTMAIAVDETAALAEGEAIGAYKRGKLAAERLVERMIADRGLPAVIVNPSTPIGPGDVKPTPTGRIILEAAAGRIPAFVDTGLNLVHVDDVAAGHLLALERGRVGERYILGGQDASLRDLLGRIATLTGRRAPRLRLPRRPLYPLAWAAELWGAISGREPFVTRDALAMAGHYMFFSSAKAERELGYRARPWADGLAEAIAWFRAEGRLR